MINAEERRFIEWMKREMLADVKGLLADPNPRYQEDGSARMMARGIARIAKDDPDNPAVAGLMGLAREVQEDKG